jgi:UV-stimulated scaffold protein A
MFPLKVKWKCRAPMSNGKLCERMDRFKCPFHGKIIGRDSKSGKATNESEETIKQTVTEIYNPLGDRAFLADIEAQTGKDLGSSGLKSKRKSKKNGNLTNLNKVDDSPRKRLEKLLCNTKSLNRIGSLLDNIERKQHYDKFHHNFSYSITQ